MPLVDVAHTGGWVGTQVLREVYQRTDWGTMEDVVLGGRQLLRSEDGVEADTETETPLPHRDALSTTKKPEPLGIKGVPAMGPAGLEPATYRL